jgi:lipid-binding SYLF domain-containing protein
MTKNATAAVPPDVFPGSPVSSESPDAGPDSTAMSPEAAGETTDPAASDPAPVAAEPAASDPAPVATEPEATDPGPATASPEALGPAPATTESDVPDPAPATTETEVPGIVAADADEPSDDVAEPDSRWTIVAAGTIPEKFGERALNATTVIEEIGSTPDQSIPGALLSRAACVAVIPNVRKVGFIIGTTYGRGVVSCRTGGGWSRPSFVSIGGGGFSVGAQSTDFVLVFVDQAATDRLVADKFELGTDASVSAGPVGQELETDAEAAPQAEIYAYARSDGSFEGVTLEGTDVEIDREANEDVYGRGVGPQELLRDDSGELPGELEAFLRVLASLAGG